MASSATEYRSRVMISRLAEGSAGVPARMLKCQLCDEPDAKSSKSAMIWSLRRFDSGGALMPAIDTDAAIPSIVP
ncbi:MAG: hypothetical protein QOH32_199, partial [Bradyrhizobium sp.]|nr:hypothetical protein [Bradyrhizobium sp.]